MADLLPTKDQLFDETDRVFRERIANAPERLDADDPDYGRWQSERGMW